ncbi:hypothetical protein SAMN05421821_102535 [Mucilaginibacter lappiensis]|uniref:Uncharacterized protein n=1 Tax=Mucilaginibacter lappiensis TaxID=354630 RepID=A0ABR6PES2_9SPHI|nr:hypothetical protein [Mucilaginibacter lappiensis]MBB6108228.1 hypothetical protein [Mucilaginibacter lappiensis]SIQ46574.1 hypothetical protein SAMN05421821_102535 [Mucilaginibacter lappiensis]
MKTLTFLLISLFLTIFSLVGRSQTCIVLKQEKDTIFVGADSKSSIPNIGSDNKISTQTYKTICKLHTVGRYNFAIAGTPDSLIEIEATKACQKGKNIKEVNDIFLSTVKDVITTYVENIRREQFDYYNYRFVNNDIASISFYGFENGRSYLGTVYFDAINKPNEAVKVKDTTVFRPFEVLGLSDHIRKQLGTNMLVLDAYLKKGKLYYIQKLIEVELKAHPDHVGLPFDLMIVTNNGAKIVRVPKMTK